MFSLQAPICAEIERQRNDVLKLNKTANLVDSLLHNYLSKQVSEIEEYITHYGFKPNGKYSMLFFHLVSTLNICFLFTIILDILVYAKFILV